MFKDWFTLHLSSTVARVLADVVLENNCISLGRPLIDYQVLCRLKKLKYDANYKSVMSLEKYRKAQQATLLELAKPLLYLLSS